MSRTFRHTAISPPSAATAEEQDFDLPVGEDPQPDVPPPSARPLPSAETALLRAAFENATTKPQRARIAAGNRLAVLVHVPDPSWVRPTDKFFLAEFGRGWATFARDGSQRVRDRETVGNDEVAAALTCGRCTVGIAASAEILPSVLRTAADISLRIRAPDAKVVRRALRLFCGTPVRINLPNDLCAGLDFHAMASCFRRGSTATEVVERLRTASQRRTATSGETLPRFEDAIEYGDFRRYGLELIQDLNDCRAGLPWSRVSRAVVVVGESGIGKTLGIRMLAQACRIPLISTSIGELFAGSARGDLGGIIAAWRATLSEARAAAQSAGFAMLLLDEIDGLPNRAQLSDRNADFWQPVIADFLTTLDGALSSGSAGDAREGIVVAATTNYIKRVDRALLRPGRLERVIHLVRPDRVGIANVLRYHLAGDLTEGDIEGAAPLVEGLTPAEVMSAVRDARRIARVSQRPLRFEDLESVLAPRSDMPIERLFRICIHEAGHVVASLALPWGEVRSIVVASRENSLAQTMIDPDSADLPTRSTIEARVTMLLAGRAAESIYLTEPAVGSAGSESSDLAMANRLIAGLHASGLGHSLSYLGPGADVLALVREDRALRRQVERDLKRLEERALSIVRANRPALMELAERLMERRHLTGDEARDVFAACGTPADRIAFDDLIRRPIHARSYH